MSAPPYVQLRPAVAADLAAILVLERATDSAPHWPEATYEAMLDSQLAIGQHCLVVARDFQDTVGSLAGFAVGALQPETASDSGNRIAELESVVVAAANRRNGIGRDLCRVVLDWCRSNGATEVVLEVRAASSGAIALYASLGFAPSGCRPRYYRNPDDDALLMRFRLNRPGAENR